MDQVMITKEQLFQELQPRFEGVEKVRLEKLALVKKRKLVFKFTWIVWLILLIALYFTGQSSTSFIVFFHVVLIAQVVQYAIWKSIEKEYQKYYKEAAVNQM